MSRQEYIVIGIDDNSSLCFGDEELKVIMEAYVFSGGKRHYLLVKDILPKDSKWIDITVPLDKVFEEYEKYEGKIVVFASGDPLFFGFAVTIQKRLPSAKLTIFPCFNSLQTLAHKVVLRYDDMTVVSLTGRPWLMFDSALIERREKIGILTDGIHTPSAIASRALEYGYTSYKMVVGECLGGVNERITTLTLQEAAQMSFIMPNCVILYRSIELSDKHARLFGIPENLFELLDGRQKMITKMPIRLITLSMLNLNNKRCFWDIGFCTGSVSVEVKMQFPQLEVNSFEIREECKKIIETNSKRFGVPGINAFVGDFNLIDNFSNLKNSEGQTISLPDSIFIGGHGGTLIEIVKKAEKVLSDGGVIVFNAVSESSKELFIRAVESTDRLVLTNTIVVTIDDNNTIEVMQAMKNKLV